MMNPSDSGLELIRTFEGIRLDAYQDAVGVWTIGIGHTGDDVIAGRSISEAEAMVLLRADAETAAAGVRSAVTVALSQGQFDALVSFAFNLGVAALKQSTLLNKLNAGDVSGAAEEFPRWVHAGGRKLNGLVKRRAAERALFLGLDWRA